MCIPRLYAAASLKLMTQRTKAELKAAYSAALCRGLIEAALLGGRVLRGRQYSAALCRGLIEARARKKGKILFEDFVFRGFMPRPH